jgi:hypothetical protein
VPKGVGYRTSAPSRPQPIGRNARCREIRTGGQVGLSDGAGRIFAGKSCQAGVMKRIMRRLARGADRAIAVAELQIAGDNLLKA